ncbi:MAG: hypothetical protein EBX18_04700, partial [Actinobacteria bacterium]|nr:hypothetical protein [Actinomycetota bacterium]
LPHWSEAPTGESPRFTAEQPVTPPTTPPPVRQPARSGRVRIGVDPTDPRSRPRSDTHPTMRPVTNPTPRDRTNPTVRDRTGGERRASADVSGAERRPVIGDRQPRRPAPVRPEQVRRRRPDRSDSGTQPRPVGRDRNLGSAVIVGAVLAALFIGTSLVGPAAVMALVVADADDSQPAMSVDSPVGASLQCGSFAVSVESTLIAGCESSASANLTTPNSSPKSSELSGMRPVVSSDWVSSRRSG